MSGLNLNLLQSEFGLFSLAMLVFFADLLSTDGKAKRGVGYLTAAGLLVILIWSIMSPAADGNAFNGMYLSDGLARIFKIIFIAAAFLTTLASLDYLTESGVLWQGEFYLLILLNQVEKESPYFAAI